MEGKQRRPGGRSARVRGAVIRAFLDSLVESGYSQLTFEGLAERAGVHKTTLYRRWGSRENLLLDAALEGAGNAVPVPDTGSLEGDLRQLGRAVADYLQVPVAQAMLRSVLGEAMTEPKVAAIVRQFWTARFARIGEIVRRAAARGEIAMTGDEDLLLETLVGPIYLRVLVRQERPDPEFIAKVAHLVAVGAMDRAPGSALVAEVPASTKVTS